MDPIRNLKGCLHEPRSLELLALCHYRPTKDKLRTLAQTYMADPAVMAYGYYTDEERHAALLILREVESSIWEILGIAVDPACRGWGIGRTLIRHAIEDHSCRTLFAETDDDAVGFYRACGFTVQSLGEKYPGVVRYRCEWLRS